MYRHILVAIDGSPNAEKALDHAIRFMDWGFGSKLTVLHVQQPPNWTVSAVGSLAPSADYVEWHRRQAEAVIRHDKEKVARLPFTETVIANGNPATEIINYAQDYHCDLILTGCRGLGPIQEMMLGSVSHHVVHHSKVPVLVVK